MLQLLFREELLDSSGQEVQLGPDVDGRLEEDQLGHGEAVDMFRNGLVSKRWHIKVKFRQ